MANDLTTRPITFAGKTTDIMTVLPAPLGTRALDTDGNEFMLVQGVASLDGTHNWVSLDENIVTTLLAANAVGRVGVVMSVLDATTKYGWAQVYGKNTIAGADTTADNKQLFIDATAGRVDDAAVSGDGVYGAISRSTDTSNLITVELSYPFVTDTSFL